MYPIVRKFYFVAKSQILNGLSAVSATAEFFQQLMNSFHQLLKNSAVAEKSQQFLNALIQRKSKI
jgi:flagellar biosynthesis regulator FlbT